MKVGVFGGAFNTNWKITGALSSTSMSIWGPARLPYRYNELRLDNAQAFSGGGTLVLNLTAINGVPTPGRLAFVALALES